LIIPPLPKPGGKCVIRCVNISDSSVPAAQSKCRGPFEAPAIPDATDDPSVAIRFPPSAAKRLARRVGLAQDMLLVPELKIGLAIRFPIHISRFYKDDEMKKLIAFALVTVAALPVIATGQTTKKGEKPAAGAGRPAVKVAVFRRGIGTIGAGRPRDVALAWSSATVVSPNSG
jgi:hypothetical protein